jgi:acyl carrier protein
VDTGTSHSTDHRVKKILVRVKGLAVPPEEIRDEQLLTSEEIGLDSLSLLEAIVRLEAEFGILIPDSDVLHAQLKTVGNLAELVVQHMEHEGRTPGNDGTAHDRTDGRRDRAHALVQRPVRPDGRRGRGPAAAHTSAGQRAAHCGRHHPADTWCPTPLRRARQWSDC